MLDLHLDVKPQTVRRLQKVLELHPVSVPMSYIGKSTMPSKVISKVVLFLRMGSD